MSDWRMAVNYRNRAELLRSFATQTEHEEHRQALNRVAEHYDSMAATVEQEIKDKD